MTFETCKHYYRRHLLPKQQFYTNTQAKTDSSYFQRYSNITSDRPMIKHLRDFEEAICLKLSGQLNESLNKFFRLLKDSGLTREMRSECHYQVGEILQWQEAQEVDWLKHLVASLTFNESYFSSLDIIKTSELYQNIKSTGCIGKDTPRVLIVLGSNAATVTFANHIFRKLPAIGVIQQYAEFPFLNKDLTPGRGEPPFGLTKEDNNLFNDEKVLGNIWNALYLDQAIPNIYVSRGELNKPYILHWVRLLKPDIIVSHGPEPIGPEFISLAKHGGINVHWGLSPTYRGMDTTRWPLIEKKPEWVGVTIHMLDEGLDTGPIIYQEKPDLIEGDTFRMIEYRLTMLACEIVPRVIMEVANDKIKTSQQNLNIGKQYWADQWSNKYELLLCRDYIAEQIKLYHKDKANRDNRVELINPWTKT